LACNNSYRRDTSKFAA